MPPQEESDRAQLSPGGLTVCPGVTFYPGERGEAAGGPLAMQNFLKCFVRDQSGAWRCIAPADLQTPQGRIQVTPGSVFTKGTRFMNVDLAVLLDEAQAKEHRRSE
jgi:hypothetical protein